MGTPNARGRVTCGRVDIVATPPFGQRKRRVCMADLWEVITNIGRYYVCPVCDRPDPNDQTRLAPPDAPPPTPPPA